MITLYRENCAYSVPEGLVPLRLAQGFTRQPLVTKPKAIAPDASIPEGKINVNTCKASELVALSGIGIATANQIIDGRPYESLDWFAADPRTVPHFDKFVL